MYIKFLVAWIFCRIYHHRAFCVILMVLLICQLASPQLGSALVASLMSVAVALSYLSSIVFVIVLGVCIL